MAWRAPGAYHVFDILWLDGENVTPRPLHERQALLSRLPLETPLSVIAKRRARLDRAEAPTSPFTRAVGLPRLGAHWVRPEIVVRVAFIEWTVHGKLRHPRLVGIREDKEPREVVRETS